LMTFSFSMILFYVIFTWSRICSFFFFPFEGFSYFALETYFETKTNL
jgi:hypothetical protein